MSRWLLALSLVVSLGVLAVPPPAKAQSPEVLSYRIEHETWGDIGTFTNTIRREDGRTIVEARLRIAVEMLFGSLVLYREEADRQETWENGRLTAYESTTSVDGEIIRVSGRAAGESFVIQRPDGVFAAPADVRPTNLWSIDMKTAKTVMGTKSGVLVSVAVTDGGRRSIEIDDRKLDTRYFRIDPRSDPGVVPFPQEGWFDEAGIPVRFAVVKDGDSVVFTMTGYWDARKDRTGGS